jgi:hypothetical protein
VLKITRNLRDLPKTVKIIRGRFELMGVLKIFEILKENGKNAKILGNINFGFFLMNKGVKPYLKANRNNIPV